MKQVEYEIVNGQHPEEISTLVRQMIFDGWLPHGGLCYAGSRGYFKEMIRTTDAPAVPVSKPTIRCDPVPFFTPRPQ